MQGTLTILRKEWRCFIGSDRGMFLLYAILTLSWSIMLAAPRDAAVEAESLWLVFFSVVISANFSNTVFISERINGILEILLTSGLSRKNILYGKMLFSGGMSTGMGLLCIALSYAWRPLLYGDHDRHITGGDVAIYISAVYMNTAGSAWLSVLMANPRLLHLVNLLTLAALVISYRIASLFFPVPWYVLSLAVLGLGFGATFAARRLYESERILQPVIL